MMGWFDLTLAAFGSPCPSGHLQVPDIGTSLAPETVGAVSMSNQADNHDTIQRKLLCCCSQPYLMFEECFVIRRYRLDATPATGI